MPDRIHLLPETVSNQIAAGEVVLGPASVVKEMVENAVDAGAKNITVNFRNGGRDLIQIVDDGCGMSPADARLAFDRHATSKIRTAEEIYALHTFGFRGEALASIAAVAEVELRTRQQEEPLGCLIGFGGGELRRSEAVNCPVGSQFLVRELFFNTPARRRKLERSNAEGRNIREALRRVALCHPEVGFQLLESDQTVLNLPAGSLRNRITGIFGRNTASKLLEIDADTSVVRIEGFTGRPDSARQRNSEHYFFVNGRHFESPYLQKAVLTAYEKLIPQGVQPSWFVYLTVDPSKIDVNISPQKTDVHFEDGALIWQIVMASVREALAKQGVVPMIDFDAENTFEIPVLDPDAQFAVPAATARPDFNPFAGEYAPAPAASGANLSAPRTFQSAITPDTSFLPYPSGEEQGIDLSLIDFIEGDDARQTALDLDGEVTFTGAIPLSGDYAAASIGGTLVVVDLRRAQEAVAYDNYMRMVRNGSAATQQLLFPETVIFSADYAALLQQNAGELAALGFEISRLDDFRFEVKGIPPEAIGSDPGDLICEILEAIDEEGKPGRDVLLERMAAAAAASCARKKSDSPQIPALLEALSGCQNISFTPGGLPVIVRIEESELRKRFRK